MDAPEQKNRADGEGDGDYWPSVLGPARPLLPFVFGCSFPIAIVAFFCLFHSGKEAGESAQFAAAVLVSGWISLVALAGVGGTIYALAHPSYPLWKKIALFFAWRLPIIAIAAVWFWVGFKREWFGSFSLELPSPDGVPGAKVGFGDLAAGFLSVPLAIGIYYRHWLKETYCKADPRTLGMLRIVLGCLLVGDSIRHWKEARWFYANTGVLTNHLLLYKPFSNHNFSLWNAFSSLAEVHVLYAAATLCFFCFLIGYRTRLFSILSFLLVTSQDNRLVLVENGGYVVVNVVIAWAMFMPLGLRFSVDSLLRSYREHKEKSWADLNQRFRPADQISPVVGSIFLLAIVNLAIVYFFNVVNKSGNIWKSGLTVHYVLHLDRMVTGIAVWFRELGLPLWFTRFVTWAVLALEALVCTWILSPFGRRYTRPLAMAGMHALHGVFGVMFRLGPFSWFLIGWSYMLLSPENWADLEARHRRKAPLRAVVLDRSSPLAFAIGRLLARLDSLDLLTFEPSADAEGEARPPLCAVRMEDGKLLTGTAAFREITRALRAGRLVRIAAWIGTFGALGAILSFLSRQRDGVARFFGLGLAAKGAPELPRTSPLRDKLASARVTTRETLLAYLAVCAFLQVLTENKCFPPQFRPRMPSYMQATVGYPRMFQGWGMFAANPITDDGSISIDAITIDGRHIDPFTGQPPDLDLSDARGLGLNQIWQDYFNRIRVERNKVYRQGLRDYLVHWHEETGNPNDELVAFDVYWLRDQCPRPGETKPWGHEKIALLTYRKPGYRPAPGLPPLPPEPRIGNGEAPAPPEPPLRPAGK
jgi:hypothetical protein